jgi:hypothetical protein
MTIRGSIASDGRTLTVRVPLTFRKRGGRKQVVAPTGTAWQPPSPRVDCKREAGALCGEA